MSKYKTRLIFLKGLLKLVQNEMAQSLPPDDGNWFEETNDLIKRIEEYIAEK